MIDQSDDPQSDGNSVNCPPLRTISRRRLLSAGSTIANLVVAGYEDDSDGKGTRSTGAKDTTAADVEPDTSQAGTPLRTPIETDVKGETASERGRTLLSFDQYLLITAFSRSAR